MSSCRRCERQIPWGEALCEPCEEYLQESGDDDPKPKVCKHCGLSLPNRNALFRHYHYRHRGA